MPTTRVLIAVKTYPTLSEKYDELVCTAGFLEDGTWIRIYPIPFRKLSYDKRYSKWQWIELDLVKNTSDFRKESFRPANIDNEIKIVGEIDTKNGWAQRKSIVLKHVRYNMAELIEEAKNPQIGTSLAVFKPQRIVDFVWEESSREWNKQKLDAVYANQAQQSLFDVEETKRIFKREFEIKSKNSKLSVIDKLYVNGGLLFKKAVCRDSRQGVGYKVTE